MFGLISALTKVSISLPVNSIRHISTHKPLLINATPVLWAEPLRKKKRLDPAVLKAREERKKKKIEKQIRRLEKHARQLKPIDECEVPISLIDDKKKRTRPVVILSEEEQESQDLLQKEWTRVVTVQRMYDYRNIDRIMSSQKKALDKLREVSEELYQEAIQVDLNLVPYVGKGPVHTPPIENYDSPDGEYIDITKNWTEF